MQVTWINSKIDIVITLNKKLLDKRFVKNTKIV